MSRRRRPEKRVILPDPKFKDLVLSKFMNNLMMDGKKSTAERIVYGAFDSVEAKAKKDPLQLFHDALNNIKPALAIRWMISAARGRSETTMAARLSGEILDASNNRGNAVKKREDAHKMAEANRAFAHYRW